MIWLVGCKGMLGQQVAAELQSRGVPLFASDREIDVTNPAAVDSVAPQGGFSWVINCSGYTAVDQAETDKEAAWALNRDAVVNLARYCSSTATRMLHISTDYVFDGEQKHAYTVDAAPNPRSVYGASKAAGEQALRAGLDEHVIIRTAWLYAEHGKNFLLTILRLLGERDSLTVVRDQHGSPTYARDLAAAITTVVLSGSPRYGTYHFTNAGATTWYDFACRIQSYAIERKLLSTPRPILPVSSDRYPIAASRPQNSVLDCTAFTRDYGTRPRTWQEALGDCLTRVARMTTVGR